MSEPLQSPLIVQNLVKDYGNLRAVNQVCFELQPGEVFGLLGPNGAGKTSIISIIVSLEKATSGEVFVFGQKLLPSSRELKFQIGIVPQELINHGYFDISEVLRFHSGYYGLLKNKSREDYLLHRLGLWEHRHKKVKQLSGGMKRRLLIAKALVHHPPLLLLDEPTAGVDIELRSSLWDFVGELKKEGMTILLTTHYLEEAEKLCDRVGVILKGELKRLGETRELISELTGRRVLIKQKSSVSLNWRSHSFFKEYISQTNEWEFCIPSAMGVGELLSQLKISIPDLLDLRIQEGSLEEAFKKIILTK